MATTSSDFHLLLTQGNASGLIHHYINRYSIHADRFLE